MVIIIKEIVMHHLILIRMFLLLTQCLILILIQVIYNILDHNAIMKD